MSQPRPRSHAWRRPIVVALVCGAAAAYAMQAHLKHDLSSTNTELVMRANVMPIIVGYASASVGLLLTALLAVRTGELTFKDVVLALACVVVPSAFLGSCLLSFAVAH